MKKHIVSTIVLILLSSVVTSAATLLVPDQYPTIQAGIDAALNGDTIIVAPGTYTDTGNRDIDFFGKAITVKSESGPANTIIDCNASQTDPHRAFYFHNNEDANSILAGFTITGGFMYSGGAIYCEAGYENPCNPTITDCIITRNIGGGIYGQGDVPNISKCIFTRNSGQDGGAISGWTFDWGPRLISNCLISENSSMSNGGGIAGYHGSIENCRIINNYARSDGGGIWLCGRVRNCVIAGNFAGSDGGGLSLFDSAENCIISGNKSRFFGGGIATDRGNIQNCVIIHNKAISGGGICGMGSEISNTSQITLNNSIVYYNSADAGSQARLLTSLAYIVGPPYTREMTSKMVARYCDIQGVKTLITVDPNSTLIWEKGNIDVDPDFVATGQWDPNGTPADADDDFWINGDYHLRPGSTCINAGDPNYVAEPDEIDFDGRPRVIDGRIDMGAYEFVPKFRLFVTPTVLWPPNHKMVKITPTWTVSDDGDSSPEVSLVGVTNNDKNAAKDIQINNDGSIYLRAEKSRIYTVTYKSCDESGNCTTRSATVTVPHDNGK